jgi:hypothetical protein
VSSAGVIVEQVRRGFRKAKAMPKDSAAQLAKALSELKGIVDAQREASEKVKRQAVAWSNAVSEAQKASGEAWTAVQSANGDTYAALREWAIAQVAMEKAREVSINLQRAQFHDDPMEVLRGYPNAKAILAKVVELRLAVARDELSRVTAREQTRLDEEYGVGQHDADDSPPVRQLARKIESLQTAQQRITDESIETTWPVFAKAMAQSDSNKGKYVQKSTAEVFTLTMGTRLNADGEQEPVYRLSNDQHVWEGDEKQFREQFERL